MSRAIQLIIEIERDFNQLQKEYNLFLNEVVKVEPTDLKVKVARKVKMLRNISGLRTDEQFRTNNLVSKVQSYLHLWERQLEKKYESTEGRKPVRSDKEKTAKPQRPAQKSVVIKDASEQREQVVELYDEYMRLNLLLGGRKMINFAKFQKFINNQTRKIQTAKKVGQVRYQIKVQDQKVVIKSKSVKNESGEP